MLKTLKYIFTLFCFSSFSLCINANCKSFEIVQPAETIANHVAESQDSITQQTQGIRGIQYSSTQDSLNNTLKKTPLIAGFTISGDIAGAIMAAATSYGQYEGAFRVNLKGRFFPIVEIGIGRSNHTDVSTNLHYKTNAPFFRIGCDYNFARNIRDAGRILGGLRYGYSSYSYDIDGPDIEDPIWGDHISFSYRDKSGKTHWAEVVFGVEARIWSFFHLGWNVRYRFRLSDKVSDIGNPWYVPGYGKNDTHALSGMFNIIFDI